MRRIFLPATSILVLGALLSFSMACSKRPSDDTIAKDIQNRVAADPDTKNSNVSVVSKDGKVPTGTASDPAAQQKLEQIARQEPGIVGVDNEAAVPPVVVPPGTDLVVTTSQTLGSKTSQTGQSFLASVAQPVTVGGRSAIPKGSAISGTVVTAKEKGKVRGRANCLSPLQVSPSGGKRIRFRPILWTVRSKARGSGQRQLPGRSSRGSVDWRIGRRRKGSRDWGSCRCGSGICGRHPHR